MMADTPSGKKNIAWKNPVLPGFHADPSVCRVGSDFYLVNSSFDFFPGIPVFHSVNLVNWEIVSHAWTRKSQFDMTGAGASRGLFAPTIRFHSGEFFIAVTDVSGTGNCILRSGDPEGPWSDPVPVAQGGIDPSLFFDDDGSAYFCTNATVDDREGIALSVINPVTGEIRSPVRSISSGSGGRYPEAPHLYKFHGLYYLALAEGGTEYGHMETIFRSTSPWGPYVPCPRNPILTHRDESTDPIQCAGHADFFDDENGNLWAVCLGVRTLGPLLHNIGRETFLLPAHWDDGLWPVAGNDGIVASVMEGPLPAPPSDRPKKWEPSFPSGGFDPEWNFVRTPDVSRYDFADGTITVRGGKETLSENHSGPAMAIRRQEEIDCAFTAKVALSEVNDGGSTRSADSSATGSALRSAARSAAGICAYYSDSYHYEMFLRDDGHTRSIVLRKRIHDLEAETAREPLPADFPQAVLMRIRADKSFYYFEYGADGSRWQELGRGMTAGLCTEGTYHMTFTGTYLGIFAESGTGVFSRIAYESA